jgi:predicted HTH domain antitoxin
MDYIRVRKTDLARNTSQIIRNVLRGQTTVIESHGQPEVAMMEIVDFQLQRAAVQYFGDPQKYEQDIEIDEATLKKDSSDVQARYDLILGHYLALHLSLARAGELLGMSSHELRLRLARLGIPLQVGPRSIEGAKEEVQAIENMGKEM